MRSIRTLIIVLSSLICLSTYGQAGNKDYPEADAVYLQLSKTYVLNKDGSMVSKVEKRQKLLTHRAFQTLFGETRITYNPKFQEILVNHSFTENDKKENIETPQNGYNEVLPSFANNLKAFSHLRENVITHTGLEKGSIINCAYEMKGKPGVIPWLMGDEPIQTDCPIEKLNITISVPTGTSLNYKLLNANSIPKTEHKDGFDTYSWQFRDVVQRIKEPFSQDYSNMPRLIFSTQPNQLSAINWIKGQDAFKLPVSKEIIKYVENRLVESKTKLQKILKIQEIVVKDINLRQIPANLLAFQVRTPDEVWQSNGGTTLEKSCLLSAILRAEGIKSDLCLIVPKRYKSDKWPYILAVDPVVRITLDKEGTVLISAEKLNTGNFDLCNDQQELLSMDNVDNESSILVGEIDVEGKFELDADGKIQGKIDGIFFDRFNPYFDLVRNDGQTKKIFAGVTGTAINASQQKTTINFLVEKSNTLTQRGTYKFLDLFESGVGISSLHLTPLPFKRISPLDLGSPIAESYHYYITVPKLYSLVNSADTIIIAGQTGKLLISFRQKDQVITIKKELQIHKSTISAESYPEFRKLMNIWISSKYRQLILKTE